MTAAEACGLLVDTTRALSRARAECDSWRLVAVAAIESASELRRQLEMVDDRQYIHRTRVQEERDLRRDQRDLGRAA